MEVKEFLIKTLERAEVYLNESTNDLTLEEMKWRPGLQANPIGFILWHLTRGEDRFVANIQQKPQVWEDPAWPNSLNLPPDPNISGFGFTSEQVAAFPVPPLESLLRYHKAVRERTLSLIQSMTPADFDRVIEHPRLGKTTTGELFARIVVEISQHTGQINYLRGLKRSQ
ncbi:MAG: DinB family protein [Chloroflexota bacterium]